MPRRSFLRSKSLILPEVKNPFVHRLRLSTKDKIQIAIMSVTIVPLRLVLLVIFLLVGWFFAFISLAGRSEEEKKQPMSGWRSFLRPLVVFACRGVFFAGSFHWVKVKGKRASPFEAPIIALASHSSYLDALVSVKLDLDSVVAKTNAGSVPFFGTLSLFTQPVFVSREDPNSRLNTIKEIENRAKSGGKWPQVVIFPEGTCTNRSCLITYKLGAFYPGVPVQPVCIKYPNKLDTITWTWDGPGAFSVFWLTVCQFHTKLEIEFLPVYTPSEAEKQDAKLFATNVRDVMSKALGVPITDHTFDDCRLMTTAAKLNFPGAAALVETNKLTSKLGLKYDKLKEHLEKFCTIAQKSTGDITLEQFAQYLDLPVSDSLIEMFNLYDRDGSGNIDFREYVIGFSLLAAPANDEQTIKLAFRLFDRNNSGYITQDDLSDMLFTAFNVEDEDAERLFQQVDTDCDGKISYDEFKAYAEQKPEYARLFLTYKELQDLKDDEPVISMPGSKVKLQ